MNNQSCSSFDNAAIIEAAKKSAQKQAEAQKKSKKIFEYYSRRRPTGKF